MKQIFISLLAALALAGCANRDNSAATADKADPAPPAAQAVATIEGYAPDGTVHELDSPTLYVPGVRVPNLTVLDFNAVWCGPCRQLAPVLHDMAREFEGRVTFVSIDVDTYGTLFEAFNVGQSIPAVVFMKPDGTSFYTVGTGDLLPAEKFKELIERNL